MLNKVCKKKIDETVEKVVKTQRNQDDGNSNTAYTCFKFVNFASTIDQII